MGVETAAVVGADAAPLSEEEGVAEEIRPDLHPVEAPFVLLRADAGKGDAIHAIGEERLLSGCGPGVDVAHRENSGAFGRPSPGSVTARAGQYQEKRPRGRLLAEA
jgi:hypothetical protein